MAQNARKVIRYSNSFRRQVVEEVEGGMSIHALQKRYGIKGGVTIQNWLRKFGKTHLLKPKPGTVMKMQWQKE